MESIEHRLVAALREPLPGEPAHRLMAPVPRPGWDPEQTPARHSVEDHGRERGQDREPGSGAGRPAAVLLLVYPGSGQEVGAPALEEAKPAPTILLTERTSFVEWHKRQISFPGGVIEEGETVEQAAVREAFEETGVPMDLPRLLGRLSPLWVPATCFTIHPVIGIASSRPPLAANPKEVGDIIEVRLTHLLDPRSVHTASSMSRGRWVHAPYFDLDGRRLWGASAMITAEFLTLLGWEKPPVTSLQPEESG